MTIVESCCVGLTPQNRSHFSLISVCCLWSWLGVDVVWSEASPLCQEALGSGSITGQG